MDTFRTSLLEVGNGGFVEYFDADKDGVLAGLKKHCFPQFKKECFDRIRLLNEAASTRPMTIGEERELIRDSVGKTIRLEFDGVEVEGKIVKVSRIDVADAALSVLFESEGVSLEIERSNIFLVEQIPN